MAKPSYTCTFPTKNHPNATSVIANVGQYFVENWPWTSEVTPERYLAEDMEASSTWTLPNIPDDRIEALTKWYTWGFLLDDMLEVKGSVTAEYVAILMKLILGQVLPDRSDKIQAVTYDTFQAFIRVTDEESREIGRVLQGMNVEWMMHTMEAVKKSVQPVEITLEEYIQGRAAKAGTRAIWTSIKWALRIKLSQSVSGHHLVRRLEDIANEHTVVTNDLYSYRKEVKRVQKHGGVGSVLFDNAVAIIMQEKKVTAEAAYEDVYMRLRHLEDEYWRLEELVSREFKGREKEDLLLYLENIRFWRNVCRLGISRLLPVGRSAREIYINETVERTLTP